VEMEMDIYETLLRDRASLRNAEEADPLGLDNFLSEDKVKVASLSDLSSFFRISQDSLVHKSKRDLWRINETKKGEVIIERLFDPETKEPIKV